MRIRIQSETVFRFSENVHLINETETDSDLKKPVWIHFHLRHNVFTTKGPLDLSDESRTGFTLNPNTD